MARTFRSLRDRVRWVWQQESAWADVVVAGALLIWSIIDLTAAPGVTDRTAFAMYGWIPNMAITAFTISLTILQVAALLWQCLIARCIANFLQGTFWGVVSLTLMFNAVSVVTLLVSCTLMMTAISWAGLARVTRCYSAGG